MYEKVFCYKVDLVVKVFCSQDIDVSKNIQYRYISYITEHNGS